MDEDIVVLLKKRAEIRRQISTRKSVQEGKPDRIADLLERAAEEIEAWRDCVRIDAMMDGPRFMGANTSQLRRCWEKYVIRKPKCSCRALRGSLGEPLIEVCDACKARMEVIQNPR